MGEFARIMGMWILFGFAFVGFVHTLSEAGIHSNKLLNNPYLGICVYVITIPAYFILTLLEAWVNGKQDG